MKIMRTVKTLILCAAAVTTTLTAGAQEIGDMLRYSQYNYSLSTARSAAMGGAFTSLGADLSSMSINPAGLGMYRSSEVLISPHLSSATINSCFAGRGSDYTKTKFNLGSIGTALNLMNGNGSLTSFTLGIGYNKLVDFNTTSLVNGRDLGPDINPSMLNYFAGTIQGQSPVLIGHETWPFEQLGIYQWGGVLGYQTNMLNETSQGSNQYVPAWGTGTRINNTLRNITRGSVGEFDISGGFNFNNIVYMGMTIGIQDLYYRNENIYNEASADYLGEGSLSGFSYSRLHTQTGTGVNFKFGLIIRPINNLRIGVAVHTPTYVAMEYKYIQNMVSVFNAPSDKNRNYDSSPIVFDYNMNTAPRFLAGISYAQPGIGLISVDYERVWYNGMRIRETGDWAYEEDMKNDIKAYYRPANNVRVGLELTPMPNLFVRGGFAYYDDCMRYNDIIAENKLDITSYNNYSAGIGYRFSNNISVDLSYVYSDYKYANSELYYGSADLSGAIKTTQNRHTFLLAVGFKF